MDMSHRARPEATQRACYSWIALEDYEEEEEGEEEDHFRVQNMYNRLVEKARYVAGCLRCRLLYVLLALCALHVSGAMLFFVAENGEQCRLKNEYENMIERRREEMLQRIARLQFPDDGPNFVDDLWLNRTMDTFLWYESRLADGGDQQPEKRSFRNWLLLMLASVTTGGYRMSGPSSAVGRCVFIVVSLIGVVMLFRVVVDLGYATFLSVLNTADFLKRLFLLARSTNLAIVLLAVLIVGCLTVQVALVWNFWNGADFLGSVLRTIFAGSTVGFEWVNMKDRNAEYFLTLYPLFVVPLLICMANFYVRERKTFLSLVRRKLRARCLNLDEPRDSIQFEEILQEIETCCRAKVVCGWMVRLSNEDKTSLRQLLLDTLKPAQWSPYPAPVDISPMDSYLSSV